MSCADMAVSGVTEEGEDYMIETMACVNNEACSGWSGEVNGQTVSILGCGEGASKLALGFAAMVVAAASM